jgi:hypothetical protein
MEAGQRESAAARSLVAEAGTSRPPIKRPKKKGVATKRDRKLELGYWCWTSAVLGILPLVPDFVAGTPASQHGELLWSAIAVTSTALVRMEIDGAGDRDQRLIVFLASLGTAAGAFCVLKGTTDLAAGAGLVFSAAVFAASLVSSFVPTVIWHSSVEIGK